jgi:hypothetical protein
MTSPRSGPYTTFWTSTRSPGSSVGSIEPEGMKKAWTTKVLRMIASASATTNRIGSSCRNEPCSFCSVGRGSESVNPPLGSSEPDGRSVTG